MAEDPFRDVENEIAAQRGVLDCEAFQNHERIIDRANPQGVGFDFQCNCLNCNRQSVVTIPWAELVVASVGALPLDSDSQQAWVMGRGCMYPPVRCAKCHQPLSVPITPDKAGRYLRTGISMNSINQQWVQVKQQETLQAISRVRR